MLTAATQSRPFPTQVAGLQHRASSDEDSKDEQQQPPSAGGLTDQAGSTTTRPGCYRYHGQHDFHSRSAGAVQPAAARIRSRSKVLRFLRQDPGCGDVTQERITN